MNDSDLTEVLPQFCPDCGAGCEGKSADGRGLVFRAPRGWPICGDCPECTRRDRVRMMQAGHAAAMQREAAFWQTFMNDQPAGCLVDAADLDAAMEAARPFLEPLGGHDLRTFDLAKIDQQARDAAQADAPHCVTVAEGRPST